MSVPEGVKTPQDRRPAAQAEVEGGTADLVWRDMTFTVPADVEDLPMEFIAATENGRASEMIRLCIGAKEFGRLSAAKPHPTVRDMRQIGDQISSLYGFDDAGN